MTALNRKWLYLASVLLFGILLGADPAAMGTVKDTIVLFGSKGVFFKPRTVRLYFDMTDFDEWLAECKAQTDTAVAAMQ